VIFNRNDITTVNSCYRVAILNKELMATNLFDHLLFYIFHPHIIPFLCSLSGQMCRLQASFRNDISRLKISNMSHHGNY